MTPREILARHGSSFHLASRFLRPVDARDIAILYAACRLIDDLADEETGRADDIQRLLDGLRRHSPEAIPVEGFAEMATRRQLNLAPLVTLTESACREARAPTCIASEAELLDYCYAVAGTVGEMMCPLLGADPHRGRDAAVSLGIAMQMTNVARDVLEDARQERRYLPADWVDGLSPAAIAAADSTHRHQVSTAIRRLVELGEQHYQQAESGFPLIPMRNRQAIRIATRLYRAIGLRVVDQGCQYWLGRVSLTHGERARLAFGTLAGLMREPARPAP